MLKGITYGGCTDIPGVDVVDALINIGGGRDLYLWVVKTFLDNHAGAAIAVQKALADGDSTTAEHVLHAARGVIGNIGAHGTAEVAAELEASIRKRDPREITNEILQRFTTDMTILVTSLSGMLEANGEEEGGLVMKDHCDIGRKIIGQHTSRLLHAAATLAQTHHEKWDGSGYPSGLKGTDIPLFSRIVALGDVFDALTSERPYKKAWPVERAIEEIVQCSGRHFDPDVVHAFLRRIPEMVKIKEQFADTSVIEEQTSPSDQLPEPAKTDACIDAAQIYGLMLMRLSVSGIKPV